MPTSTDIKSTAITEHITHSHNRFSRFCPTHRQNLGGWNRIVRLRAECEIDVNNPQHIFNNMSSALYITHVIYDNDYHV